MTDVQDRIDDYWSDRAEGYHAFQEGRFGNEEIRDVWAAVFAEVLPTPPARVLDVGTGTGHVAMLLADLGHEVVGVDSARGMLDRARATAGERGFDRPPRFVAGDAVAPPVDGRFDAITARYVLWTMRETDRALAAWRALLRPGGLLVAVDATWFPDGFDHDDVDGAHGRQPGIQSRYDDEVVAALPLATATSIDRTAEVVAAAGFQDVQVTALQGVLEIDRRYGVADGHELRQQYRVTARAPA